MQGMRWLFGRIENSAKIATGMEDQHITSMRVSSIAVFSFLAFVLVAPAAIADKGADHKGDNTFFGVSVSSIEFLDINGNKYCYAGTAGSLVTDGTNFFILSNNHVLAQENVGEPREPIIQPGLLDEDGNDSSCSPAGTDYSGLVVGELSAFVPLDFDVDEEGVRDINYVDAAIAEVYANQMDAQGRILDIGGLQSSTATATVGMAVQKSGRTSGHTTGGISAVGAEILVGYSAGTALFVDQIVVSGSKGAFIKSGDSGSLLVTNGTMPQAVGLLFAGTRSGIAIANRIDFVLDDLADELGISSVSMVGCATDCAYTSSAGGGGGGGDGGGGGKKGGGPDCTANPDHKKCTAGNAGNAGNAGANNAFGLAVAAQVRDFHRDSLMDNPDVVGTGLSFDENGEPVIQVYTRGSRRRVNNPIPSELDGVKVQVIVTGEFEAF